MSDRLARRTDFSIGVTYDLATVKLRTLNASVKLLSGTKGTGTPGKAAVTITWGNNDTPLLDGAGDERWIAETYSESVREPRGYDKDYADDIVSPYIRAEQGAVKVPTGPGLGYNIDQGKLDSRTVRKEIVKEK